MAFEGGFDSHTLYAVNMLTVFLLEGHIETKKMCSSL